MARKRKRTESLAQRAKRLGIVLPKAEDVQTTTTHQRRSRRSAVVGTRVAVNDAVTVGQGRITRFVVRDGDGYAVRLKGRQIAGGFATPEEAERYATALGRRKYRRLADPKAALPKAEDKATELEAQLKKKLLVDEVNGKSMVASLLELANSGAVRVTVK